ncbi:uncharacterized protein TNCV_366891 [Trichonephila clavipes]|nr:uncharacterized protein TNCV_366891 [Trichonephila clavipes]
MNLPQPPTKFPPYDKRILNAAKLVCEDSIQNSVKEAICENEGGAMKIMIKYWVANIETLRSTGLRRLKSQLKGQILSDGKCLSGKNRFIEREIDNLQSYYGSAIRRNHQSIQNMRQAIWAIFLHTISTEEYPQHG